MRKLFFLTALFLVSAQYASAQYQTYYVVEQVGEKGSAFGNFKFDWTGKKFFFESDSPDENDGLIKNFKENGNKRTFDVYPAPISGVDQKAFSAEFTTDGDDRYTFTQDYSNGYKNTYILTTQEPEESSSAVPTEPQRGSKKVSSENGEPKDEEAGVKKALNKGLSVFKKKK